MCEARSFGIIMRWIIQVYTVGFTNIFHGLILNIRKRGNLKQLNMDIKNKHVSKNVHGAIYPGIILFGKLR